MFISADRPNKSKCKLDFNMEGGHTYAGIYVFRIYVHIWTPPKSQSKNEYLTSGTLLLIELLLIKTQC